MTTTPRAQASSAPPPSTTSTVTTVGNITVVDVALGISSLSSELRQQHAEAAAHGERLLLETTSAECSPCQGVATALSDPRMQNALDHVRLVRVDREPFEEDLAELQIPSKPFPGFFCSTPTCASATASTAGSGTTTLPSTSRLSSARSCAALTPSAAPHSEEAPPPRRNGAVDTFA